MEPINAVADRIADWLRDYATQAGADGYVVGLSGGIDSSCTAVLCQRAVSDRVLAALLPCHSTPDDAEMARLVASAFGLRIVSLDLGPAYDALVKQLPTGGSELARANVKPRLRMAALYALAQTHNYLVAGTGNKSELTIGYFTKYGDGGVDVEPMGNLYKWQVRELALALGIPQTVIDRPPSAGLWVGQTDEAEIGMSYNTLDRVLAAMEAGQTGEVDPDLLAKVQHIVAASAHKRAMPPACPI